MDADADKPIVRLVSERSEQGCAKRPHCSQLTVHKKAGRKAKYGTG